MAALDRDRIIAAVRELLAAIGDDPDRSELADTPQRVAEAYAELFAGIDRDPAGRFAEPVAVAEGELVLLRDIRFRSMCEHHLLPFSGVAHIAYQPDALVVGLGTLPRVVDDLASRPQLQERLTEQIADALVAGLAPHGVLVVLEAHQDCVAVRGVRQQDASTVTLASRGSLSDPAARAEVMALIGGGR